MEDIVKSLNDKYAKEPPLAVHCGPVQEYLGVNINNLWPDISLYQCLNIDGMG